jgi:hypothetical protein
LFGEIKVFNFLVKFQPWREGHDRIEAGRALEYTEQSLKDRFMPEGQLDLDTLAHLPTLFLQETGNQPGRMARVGRITRARKDGREILLDYSYEPEVPAIPNEVLANFANELEIRDFEFSRTHWAVKDADLFRAILRNTSSRRQRPAVFQIPEFENIEPSLVSVMMPFQAEFRSIYTTLKRAAEQAGLRCRRADDIWENPAIIQDVVSLIDRSRVVICDCTGRNPNVFYEIGIAHTLGRDVILITQSEADVPFDLRHLRYVQYLNNAQGRRALSAAVLAKLPGREEADL